MVIDYAGRKTPNNSPRNKLIAALIVIAAFAIIALLVLLLVNQRHQLQLHPQQPPQIHKKNTISANKATHSKPQQHFEFYTLLPKASANSSH